MKKKRKQLQRIFHKTYFRRLSTVEFNSSKIAATAFYGLKKRKGKNMENMLSLKIVVMSSVDILCIFKAALKGKGPSF